eukprot:5622763-Pleurochrysis_carterae.AAC.1
MGAAAGRESAGGRGRRKAVGVRQHLGEAAVHREAEERARGGWGVARERIDAGPSPRARPDVYAHGRCFIGILRAISN